MDMGCQQSDRTLAGVSGCQSSAAAWQPDLAVGETVILLTLSLHRY